MVSNIEAGKRTISIEFDIVNEYSLDGNIVKVTLIPGGDTSKASVTKNNYNEDGKILHSILMDHSGNIISEVRNAYNKSGDLIYHTLHVTDMNKTKEIDIEYIDGMNRIETERIDGVVHRVSSFNYEDGHLIKIDVDEIEQRVKKVIYIDRND